jgi:hypothetical protein
LPNEFARRQSSSWRPSPDMDVSRESKSKIQVQPLRR